MKQIILFIVQLIIATTLAYIVGAKLKAGFLGACFSIVLVFILFNLFNMDEKKIDNYKSPSERCKKD